MACTDCNKNAKKVAGKRVNPQNTKSSNSTPSRMSSQPKKTVTKVIRNGNVIQR